MRRCLSAFLFAVPVGFLLMAYTHLAVKVFAQTPPQTPQQALVVTLKQLGACQSQLGPLTGLQADVIAGTYLDWPTVKQQVEAANPTLVLDVKTHLVTPKGTQP